MTAGALQRSLIARAIGRAAGDRRV
jgi:hypothetical protein